MITYHINNLSNKASNRLGRTAKAVEQSVENAVADSQDRLIAGISEKIQSFESLKDSVSYFERLVKENPDFQKLSGNVYKYKDYFINLGKRFNLTSHAIELQELRELELSSTPEIIAYSDLKNNTDCILITKIKDCFKSVPVPYREMQKDVTVEAKRKLIEDFEVLADRNIAANTMLDKENWYVVPETGDIVITDWSDCVSFGDESAKAFFRNKLKDICGLIY